MMRPYDHHSNDLEAYYGTSAPTDTDDDAPSYIETSSMSIFGRGAGDESTVGAMTTDSDLIRGTMAYKHKWDNMVVLMTTMMMLLFLLFLSSGY